MSKDPQLIVGTRGSRGAPLDLPSTEYRGQEVALHDWVHFF